MSAVIAICLGACAGALLRWQLGLWLNQAGAWMPWGTLAANLIGGYLIGLVLAVVHHHPQLDPMWRLLLVTGWLLSADHDQPTRDWRLWLLTAVATLIVWRTRIHLLWLIGAGAVLGAFGWV